MASMHSPQLYYAYYRFLNCMWWTLTTVHQKPWKGVQWRRQLSRVNGIIKMQQALNIEINAKSDPFPNLLFFLQNCGHRKAATDPRTQVQQLISSKKWFHFSPRVCDFQPPCRSHVHLFGRDNLHRTTGFLGKFIQSARGGWGGKVDIEKRLIGDKNKIRSTA